MTRMFLQLLLTTYYCMQKTQTQLAYFECAFDILLPPVQNCLIAPTVFHDTCVSKVVVDNILLYAEDSDTLLTRFECTFGILLQYQVPVKLKKCKFLCPILESWNLLELSSHPMATHLLDLTYWLLKNYSHQKLGQT